MNKYVIFAPIIISLAVTLVAMGLGLHLFGIPYLVIYGSMLFTIYKAWKGVE